MEQSGTTKTAGFTLVEIMIVVAIIGILAAIAIPAFVKSRNKSQQAACLNNLRSIDSGKEQWAIANRRGEGDTITTAEINEYIKGTQVPRCPGGGSYTYYPIGTDPDCNLASPTSHNAPR